MFWTLQYWLSLLNPWRHARTESALSDLIGVLGRTMKEAEFDGKTHVCMSTEFLYGLLITARDTQHARSRLRSDTIHGRKTTWP